MKMEQTKCSETSAYKIQTPGKHPKESIQHSGYGESLKSRRDPCFILRGRDTKLPNPTFYNATDSVLFSLRVSRST